MKQKKITNLLSNLYYLCVFVIWMTLVIAVTAAGGGVLLFFAEKMFPETIHVFNYVITDKAFDELVEGKHYHGAISFTEFKRGSQSDDWDVNNTMKLVDCYIHVGEYNKAEKELLRLYKSADKSNSDFRWTVSYRLFDLYYQMGDKKGMERAYEQMLEYDGATSDINYTNDSQCPRDILLHTLAGDFIQPFTRYPSIIMSYEKNPLQGINEMEFFIDSICNNELVQPAFKLESLILLIGWSYDLGLPFKAQIRIKEALDLTRSKGGVEKYKYYGDLSDYCYRAHDYENGRKLLDTYLKYVKNNYVPSDMEYIKTEIRRLKYLETDGKYDEIENSLEEICQNLRVLIEGNLTGMTEDQREFFAKETDVPFNYATRFLISHPSTKMANLCFDNLAFKKGLLLRSSQAVRNRIARSGDAGLLASYDRLVSVKQELNVRQYLSGLGNSSMMEDLKKEADELDKEIVSKCSDYAGEEDRSHNLRRHGGLLKHNEAMLELVDYGEGLDRRLFALLLQQNGNVSYIELGDAKKVISIVQDESIEKIYRSSELYDLVWDPIQNRLSKEISRLYYSTSGLFSQLALPALKTPQNQILADEYSFRLLSSSLQLARMRREQSEKHNLQIAMWGGITYSSPSDTIGSQMTTRGILRGDSLVYSENSHKEVLRIASILKDKYPVLLYDKERATEESFKERSGKKDIILHISTHGFFKEDERHANRVSPMHNSGLFFAGANRYWMNDTLTAKLGQEDGILRASEIQYMNLVDCRLAVLSACDTGLGYVDSNEGVYGLQRAFKLAGTDKILMSLWPVSDYHTSELMAAFYLNLTENGMDINEAFDKAQREVRRRTDFNAVQYWAGFVLLD